MMLCKLLKIDSGKWWCSVCDRNQRRLLPINARRRCIIRDRSQDPKELPSTITMAWNLTKAIAEFVASGCKTVTEDEYRRRIEACLEPENNNEHCENLVDEKRCGMATGCGCYIAEKATGEAWTCPRGKWPKLQNQ